MTVNSEAKYEVTLGEIEMANKEIAREGMLLSLPASYWEQFIKKNDVDEKALLAAGYDGDGQVDWIREEMTAKGWLGGEAVAEKPGGVEAALAKSKARSKKE